MPVSSWCLKIHFSLKQQKVKKSDKMSSELDTNTKSILIQFALVRASTAMLKQWLSPVFTM